MTSEIAMLEAQYRRGIEDACKAICPACDLEWDTVWSFDRYLHEIPEKDRDDSGRMFMPCTATNIRKLIKNG